jgi:hypothetical protein
MNHPSFPARPIMAQAFDPLGILKPGKIFD